MCLLSFCCNHVLTQSQWAPLPDLLRIFLFFKTAIRLEDVLFARSLTSVTSFVTLCNKCQTGLISALWSCTGTSGSSQWSHTQCVVSQVLPHSASDPSCTVVAAHHFWFGEAPLTTGVPRCSWRRLGDFTPSRFSEGLWLHQRGFGGFLFLWKWTPFKKCYISRQGTPANLGHFICLFLLHLFSGLNVRIILNHLPSWVRAAAGVQFPSSFIVARKLNKLMNFVLRPL